MTGYANADVELPELRINCELRSVNHRYLDISFKIPEKFRFMEPEIRSRLQSGLGRGKIECLLSYKHSSGSSSSIAINDEVLQELINTIKKIDSSTGSTGHYSAMDILNWPGVQQEQTIEQDSLKHDLVELIDTTLNKLKTVRQQEGGQLAKLIEQRCHKIEQLVKQASSLMPKTIEALQNKLKIKIETIAAQPDPDRLEQELVYLAQKMDVEEELDRLATHVQEVLATLKKNEPVGRRLDFLMQEMNREANTLGSKSANIDMTNIAIELKILIEQMREQIQNIE